MRKITRLAIDKFVAKVQFSKQNTAVQVDGTTAILLLHGNAIAKLDENGVLSVCDGGWQTSTTKERLNGLDGVSVYQKDYQWYLNGKMWDGAWTEIDQK